MKFPFDELNMCDAEDVAWVKSQRDPELWHAAAIAIVNTVGDPHGFLVWLAEQPETDRATAGYFFLGVFGADYLRGQVDFLGEGLSGKQWLRAMEAMCRRAATVGFTNDSQGLHPGFEAQRQACLDVINRGQVVDGIAIPHAILDAPFPPEQNQEGCSAPRIQLTSMWRRARIAPVPNSSVAGMIDRPKLCGR